MAIASVGEERLSVVARSKGPQARRAAAPASVGAEERSARPARGLHHILMLSALAWVPIAIITVLLIS